MLLSSRSATCPFSVVTVVVHSADPKLVADIEEAAEANGLRLRKRELSLKTRLAADPELALNCEIFLAVLVCSPDEDVHQPRRYGCDDHRGDHDRKRFHTFLVAEIDDRKTPETGAPPGSLSRCCS